MSLSSRERRRRGKYRTGRVCVCVCILSLLLRVQRARARARQRLTERERESETAEQFVALHAPALLLLRTGVYDELIKTLAHRRRRRLRAVVPCPSCSTYGTETERTR